MRSLDHVAPVFAVVELNRSISYYRQQLGFDVDFRHGDFYAGLVRDGCHIHLRLEAPRKRDRSAAQRDEVVDACFSVPNASQLASDFAKAGATFLVPLRDMPYGKEFYVSDPDGYVLAFVQPRSDSP